MGDSTGRGDGLEDWKRRQAGMQNVAREPRGKPLGKAVARHDGDYGFQLMKVAVKGRLVESWVKGQDAAMKVIERESPGLTRGLMERTPASDAKVDEVLEARAVAVTVAWFRREARGAAIGAIDYWERQNGFRD